MSSDATFPYIVVETWRAQAMPRRALPIGLVALPLLAAQYVYGGSALALAIGGVLFVLFLVFGPAGWRATRHASPPVALAAYGALGTLCVYGGGIVLPGAFGLDWSDFSDIPSLGILLGLFGVGGGGLGRDIDLELGLEAAERRAEALERAREQAELLAVRSHLDPHFLFNTLNAIAEWCQQDPSVAETALLRLATMLRTVLEGVHVQAWPLERELSLVNHLVAIHAVRDPDRFQTQHEGWETAPDLAVPPLLLLPLVENAFKHGPAAGHTGPVLIRVEPVGGGICVVVENPGPFLGRREGGHGLSMVEKRMALAYDGTATFRMEQVSAAPPRTRALLLLPGPPVGLS